MVWSGSSSVFCGATVISNEWILTASHCVDGTAAGDIQVLLGEHDYWDSDEPVRMDISEIIMHSEYNSNTVDQDFALLRMGDKIDWASNPNIRPACLPEYTAGDYDQWMSTVTGWGTTSSGGSTSSVLLEVDVQVISNSECNNAYGGITDNMLCAQDASGNGGSDACQGDSGGPLVSCGEDGNCGTTPGQNYDLIGVVSFGIGCAEKDYPGVYARTTAALDWIYTTSGAGMAPFQECPRGV
jgi:trypsin